MCLGVVTRLIEFDGKKSKNRAKNLSPSYPLILGPHLLKKKRNKDWLDRHSIPVTQVTGIFELSNGWYC